jgi:hypothetical protein
LALFFDVATNRLGCDLNKNSAYRKDRMLSWLCKNQIIVIRTASQNELVKHKSCYVSSDKQKKALIWLGKEDEDRGSSASDDGQLDDYGLFWIIGDAAKSVLYAFLLRMHGFTKEPGFCLR